MSQKSVKDYLEHIKGVIRRWWPARQLINGFCLSHSTSLALENNNKKKSENPLKWETHYRLKNPQKIESFLRLNMMSRRDNKLWFKEQIGIFFFIGAKINASVVLTASSDIRLWVLIFCHSQTQILLSAFFPLSVFCEWNNFWCFARWLKKFSGILDNFFDATSCCR